MVPHPPPRSTMPDERLVTFHCSDISPEAFVETDDWIGIFVRACRRIAEKDVKRWGCKWVSLFAGFWKLALGVWFEVYSFIHIISYDRISFLNSHLMANFNVIGYHLVARWRADGSRDGKRLHPQPDFASVTLTHSVKHSSGAASFLWIV